MGFCHSGTPLRVGGLLVLYIHRVREKTLSEISHTRPRKDTSVWEKSLLSGKKRIEAPGEARRFGGPPATSMSEDSITSAPPFPPPSALRPRPSLRPLRLPAPSPPFYKKTLSEIPKGTRSIPLFSWLGSGRFHVQFSVDEAIQHASRVSGFAGKFPLVASWVA